MTASTAPRVGNPAIPLSREPAATQTTDLRHVSDMLTHGRPVRSVRVTIHPPAGVKKPPLLERCSIPLQTTTAQSVVPQITQMKVAKTHVSSHPQIEHQIAPSATLDETAARIIVNPVKIRSQVQIH